MTTKSKYNKTHLSDNAKNSLNSLSRWMKISAIIKFIIIGLAILASLTTFLGLLSGMSNSPMGSFLPTTTIIIGILAQILLYSFWFYITLQIFQSSQQFQAYIDKGNKSNLKAAFQKNKNYWKYSIAYIFLAIASYAVLLNTITSLIPNATDMFRLFGGGFPSL